MCDRQHTKAKEIHRKKQVNVFLAEQLMVVDKIKSV